MYLLDTAIIWELRKAKSGSPDAGLVSWAAGVSSQSLYISTLSLLELESAIARLERKEKATNTALRSWLDNQVMKAFEGRVLAIDSAVARKRGQLAMPDSRDALLAATAAVHGLTIVTRNEAAFKSARVKVFNPGGYMPEAVEDSADWRQVSRSGPIWLKNLFVRS